MRKLLLLVLTAATIAAAPMALAVASPEPVRLSFGKSSVAPGVGHGTVEGDVSGSVTTVLTDLRVTGTIWHVRFDSIIEAGDRSFTADLSGILNTETGAVVMNGSVVDGFLDDAQVHEEGQLIAPATLRFQARSG